MRQPEVTLAMKRLDDRGGITRRNVSHKGMGRPIIHYSLAVPFEEILGEIGKDGEEQAGRSLAAVRKLRGMW